MRLPFLFFLWLFSLSVVSSQAQEFKFLPATLEDQSFFGHAVAQSGNYAVIGAPGENFEKGAAYLFERDGNGWTQRARLTATDGQFFDHFGWSVAIEGDYLAIGAYGSDNRGPNSGSVYIFKRQDSTWIQQIKLLPWGDPPANNQGAEFGISVSLSGNLLLVGAWRDWEKVFNAQGPAPSGYQRGAAYLFNRDGDNWMQMARLTAQDADRNDLFGRSVDINGFYAIVGAPADQAKGPYSGAAYLFEFNAGAWTQVQKISPADGVRNQRFGFAVGIDNDGHAAVGAPQDATQGFGSGAVYMYRRSAGNWTQGNKLTLPSASKQAQFGSALDLRDDRLAVGAPGFSGLQPEQGVVYRYQRNGGNWSMDATLNASDGNSQDRQGQSVSLGTNSLLIGAARKEGGGAAYELGD